VGCGAAARALSSKITSAVTSGSAGEPPTDPLCMSTMKITIAWISRETAIAVPSRRRDGRST
jgi:hypothetical protein